MNARINVRRTAPSAPSRRPVAARRAIFAAALLLLGATLGTPVHAETTTLRIGHFPNITHIQALVAHGLSRSGQGWFEQRLGPDVNVEWFVYNAGPTSAARRSPHPSSATRRTFRRAHGSPLEGCTSRSPAAMRR